MVAAPASPGTAVEAWGRVGQGRKLWDSVRVCWSKLYLSSDLYERLGKPRYVAILIGREHAAIALRAANRAPGAESFKVGRRSGGAVDVSIHGALASIGRTAPETMTRLPHRWVQGTLIVDVSPLPTAGSL